MEKYTMKNLFGFMDAKRPVRVTCTDDRVFEGPCWAYGDVQNEEEYGVDEPGLEVHRGDPRDAGEWYACQNARLRRELQKCGSLRVFSRRPMDSGLIVQNLKILLGISVPFP